MQFKYFKGLQKDKTLEVYYHVIGQQGSMLVVDVDSDKKVSRVVVRPLVFRV